MSIVIKSDDSVRDFYLRKFNTLIIKLKEEGNNDSIKKDVRKNYLAIRRLLVIKKLPFETIDQYSNFTDKTSLIRLCDELKKCVEVIDSH